MKAIVKETFIFKGRRVVGSVSDFSEKEIEEMKANGQIRRLQFIEPVNVKPAETKPAETKPAGKERSKKKGKEKKSEETAADESGE